MMSEHQAASPDPEVPNFFAPPGESGEATVFTPGQSVVPARPWGPWATIGWTLLCVVVLFVTQVIALVIFVAFRVATTDRLKIDDLATNGNVIALATLLSTPATVGLVALIIWLRGYPLRDYLALRWPPPRPVAIAFLGLAVLLGTIDLTSYLLGRPLVPTVMADVYRSAWLPGLLFAMAVLAPIGEETLFRGFLYTGIAASRAGPVVAIIVSSIGFALLHVQYDWYGIAGVAATGIYLGAVRLRSQSLYLAMILHAIANAFATLELIVQETWLK